MTDFNAICDKHGEQFIFAVIDQWERDFRVVHRMVLTLEERWNYFIRATEHANALVA